jgi:resuscitation-promoting factor RpfB
MRIGRLVRVKRQHRQDPWQRVPRRSSPPLLQQPEDKAPALQGRPGSPPDPTAAFPPAPSVRRTVTEMQPVAFSTKTVNDPSLARGTAIVRTKGCPGVKTLTYEVTVTNGVQTGKELVREVITRPPVIEIIAVGT